MANTFAQVTGLHKIFALTDNTYDISSLIEGVSGDIDTRTVVFLIADSDDKRKKILQDNGNPIVISEGDTFIWTHGSIYACNALDSRGYKFDSEHNSIASGGGGLMARGNYSHAEGYLTLADGSNSHAEGWAAKSLGNYSHAEGSSTEASGIGAHAEGDIAKAEGNHSHAEGYDTTASGECSHAEGLHNSAQGYASHVEGSGNVGLGTCAHAEGLGTEAEGNHSHAEGHNTYTVGLASHAEGFGTVASGQYQHVEGTYNTPDETSLLIVGNGTNDDNRSNAMTVSRDGHVTATAFDQSSDIRLKDVCGDIDLNKAYDMIDKCDTILYTLKNCPEDGQQIGLIAQQVQDFFPEIVGKDPSGFLTLDYARLTVIIIRVLKDLIDKINNL